MEAIVKYLLFIIMFFSVSCAGPEEKSEKLVQGADWHYKMGAGYFESREIALSIKELTTAIERDPNHLEAQHLLGFIYMGRRDYSKSLAHFNEALRIDPDYSIALNNRGALYLSMERWEDAKTDFERLLENPLYPTPELAHNNIGWAYYQTARHGLAAEHLRMAVFLRPGLCVAHNNLGLVHLAQNNRLEAANAFQTAITRCPDSYAEPHFHLGKMMMDDGHPKAVESFKMCVEIEPESNLGRRCRQYLQIR
jgi:Tfp pilus assembly protein PilF